MALAPILDNSPDAHAYELSCLHTWNGEQTLAQIRAIASGYTEDLDPNLVLTPAYRELHFELKSVRERFGIFDDPQLDAAIKALRDRSGW